MTGNWDVGFVSVAPFEDNDEKIISDENVVNVITCDFPCKILKNFTLNFLLSEPQFLARSISLAHFAFLTLFFVAFLAT